MLALDGNHNKCYLPAIQFCTGLRDPVSREMKGLLRDVGAKQLNGALKEKGLVLVRETKFNNATMYLELLSKTAGTFMLGGKVDFYFSNKNVYRYHTGRCGVIPRGMAPRVSVLRVLRVLRVFQTPCDPTPVGSVGACDVMYNDVVM